MVTCYYFYQNLISYIVFPVAYCVAIKKKVTGLGFIRILAFFSFDFLVIITDLFSTVHLNRIRWQISTVNHRLEKNAIWFTTRTITSKM